MNLPHYHILVIDNDEDEWFILRTALTRLAWSGSLKCLASGEETVQYLQQLAPEAFPALIILDYNMPKWNGRDTFLRLKALPLPAEVRVAFYSTSMSPSLSLTLQALGADACFEKPYHYDKVVEIAQSFIALAETPRVG